MLFIKILITLGGLAASATGSAFDKGNLNPEGCDFADMQRFYLEELDIETASIKLIEKNLDDPKIKGYTKQLKDGSYLIVMSKHLEPSEVRIIFAHELVHVRQLEKDQINREEFRKHYLERSFEDEAFRLSMPLAAKFYTTMNCTENKKKQKPEDCSK